MSASTPSKAFGYIRVSSVQQTLDRQTDALTTAGIDPGDIFSDKISGARQDRPGLNALRKTARPGDTITVVSLDRLGRSALHVMQTIAELGESGIDVQSLKAGESFDGATGKLMQAIMAHVAEWEKDMNAERVAEARAARAARAKDGEQVAGRPRTAMTTANIAKVAKLKTQGKSAADIAVITGLSRASVYRALDAASA